MALAELLLGFELWFVSLPCVGGDRTSVSFGGFGSVAAGKSDWIGTAGLEDPDSSAGDGFVLSEFCWTLPKGFDGTWIGFGWILGGMNFLFAVGITGLFMRGLGSSGIASGLVRTGLLGTDNGLDKFRLFLDFSFFSSSSLASLCDLASIL